MKKKFLIYILICILSLLPVVKVEAKEYGNYNTGSCIDNFGEITFKSNGNNNDVGGKVVFSDKNNNLTWNEDPVNFNVEVQATSNHKIKTVHYSINSKDGYSCKGVIEGNVMDDNEGSVNFSVIINKGWVKDMAFWGKSVNRNDGKKGDVTKSNKVNVKREMTDQEIEALESKEDTSGQSLGCNTINDLFDKYWTWIIILAPVGTILLITIDFVSSMLSGDAESLKKTGDKAIKRIIALCILIFLPVILNILFNLFEIDFCF